jgi:hypothetical protein
MIFRTKGLRVALVAVILLSIALLAWCLLKGPQMTGGYRGNAITQLPKVLPTDLSALGQLVITNYKEYRANTVRWSAAYFGCLFGAAFLSACAGVLLKLESLKERLGMRNDLAAIMAALASLLITLLTIGSFEEKWRSNRVAASGMENLAYELLKSGAVDEKDAILTRIQEINEARNLGIVGTAPSAEPETARANTSEMEKAEKASEPTK